MAKTDPVPALSDMMSVFRQRLQSFSGTKGGRTVEPEEVLRAVRDVLEKVLTKPREEIRRLRARVRKLQQQEIELKEVVETESDIRRDLESELAEAKAQCKQKTIEGDTLRKEREHLAAKSKELAAVCGRLKESIERTAASKGTAIASEELVRLREERHRLAQRASQAELEYKKANAELVTLRSRTDQLESDLAKVRADRDSAAGRLASLGQRLEHKDGERESGLQRVREMERELNVMRAQLAETRIECEHFRRELAGEGTGSFVLGAPKPQSPEPSVAEAKATEKPHSAPARSQPRRFEQQPAAKPVGAARAVAAAYAPPPATRPTGIEPSLPTVDALFRLAVPSGTPRASTGKGRVRSVGFGNTRTTRG